MLLKFINSSRLFLYLGIGLIFLALICLPAIVRVVVQPEVMETELWHVGPICALLVGAWSLPSLLLGGIDSSTSKKAVLVWLTPILFLTNFFLALLVWDAIRFWRDMLIQWVLNYSPFLTPCVIANVIAFLYFVKNEKLSKALKNPKIRILLMITFTALPLLVIGGVLYMWLA